MKSLSYFRRPKEDLERPTWYGAFISILTVTLAAYLIWYELTTHKQPDFDRKVDIQNPPSGNQIDVNIDILFHQAPCASLRVLKKDLTTHQSTTVRANIFYERYPPNDDNIIHEQYISHLIRSAHQSEDDHTLSLLTGLKEKERCRIHGSFSISKIPGNFYISHDLFQTAILHVKQLYPELYSRLNLGHTILSLTFGSERAMNEIQKDAKYGDATQFNKAGGLYYLHVHPLSCSYYLKIIPQTYTGTGFTLWKQLYQYSYHQQCYVFFVKEFLLTWI